MKKDNFGLTIMLEEAQAAFQLHNQTIDSFKSIANSLLSASSLMTGLLGAFQLFFVRVQDPYILLYNLAVILMMLSYLSLIVCCILVILPSRLQAPIKIDYQILSEAYLEKSQEDILKQRLANLLNAIAQNRPAINRLRLLITSASILLPVIVIIFLGTLLIPR